MQDIGRNLLEVCKKSLVIFGDIRSETVVISLTDKGVPGTDERDLLASCLQRLYQRIGNGIAAMEQKPTPAMLWLCRRNRRKVPAFRDIPVVRIFLPGEMNGGFFLNFPGL